MCSVIDTTILGLTTHDTQEIKKSMLKQILEEVQGSVEGQKIIAGMPLLFHLESTQCLEHDEFTFCILELFACLRDLFPNCRHRGLPITAKVTSTAGI